MTREQFIKRLEEVGFKLISEKDCDTNMELYIWDKWIHISLPKDKQLDFFIFQLYESWEAIGDLFFYKFNELEQFLIDKKIVKQKE